MTFDLKKYNMQKFKKGDKVRIINYGHLSWFSSKNTKKNFDLLSEYLNKKLEHKLLWGKDVPFNEPEPKYLEDDSTDNPIIEDALPKLVGQIGVIRGSYFDLYGDNSLEDDDEKLRQQKQYTVDGINGKSAWYNEEQLELVED